MDRRSFMKVLLGLPAVCAAGAFGGEARKPPTVLLARAGKDGCEDDLVDAVFDNLGGVRRFVKKGAKVLLKPNLSFNTGKDSGATTNPAIVRAVAKQCLDAGAAHVFIADHTIREPDSCFEASGIRHAVSDLPRTTLTALSREAMYREFELPRGERLKRTQVASLVRECDVLMNIPVAKHHSATRVCMGMKNLLGLVWDRKVFHRLGIDQCIADLASGIRPTLTIVDATRVLLTNGPAGPGMVQRLRTLMAGTDPVAVDAAGVESIDTWLGVRKKRSASVVPHIVNAHRMGVGSIAYRKRIVEV